MANVLICDLCGKPIEPDEERRYFKAKVRELKSFIDHDEFIGFHITRSWATIDAHSECVAKLFSSGSKSNRNKNKPPNEQKK